MTDPAKEDDLHCLTGDVIRQFLAGELDDEQDQNVSDHLDACASCQRLTMSFLSVDDLCLPWLKASSRETINLTRLTADTVTIRKLKLIGTADERLAAGSNAVGRRFDRPRKVSAPERIDKYEIVAAIGQGGMGTVYLGIDHDLGRECAIKVVGESHARDRKAIERAQREMQAVGRLAHPNIVSVLNAGQLTDGRSFLVMEFLRGSDLQSYVQAYGTLSADEACRAISDAARGLQHAHEQKLVHRDIKPSNLFRTDNGTIKLLDFGLVQWEHDSLSQTETLTETGVVLGTVDFMSPEQAIDSRSADHRSDIYSLGCTLAWLLSGRQVFPGNSVTRVLFAHRDNPAPQLESLQPNVPAGLNSVFQKMVAKRPEDRFQSTAEVIEALAPFTLMEHDKPVASLSPASGTLLLPTPLVTLTRNRRPVATAWLSSVALLAIIITAIIQQTDDGQPRSNVQMSGSVSSSDGDSPTSHTSQTTVVGNSAREFRIPVDAESRKPIFAVAPGETPPGTVKPKSR
jgi:serine/threonine protein kinase